MTAPLRLSLVFAVPLLAGATALRGPSVLFAHQDLVAVAPGAAKVEYEDERVRVVRLKMAPHTSSPMHDRPRRVVIPLSTNDVRITRPDGSVGSTRAPALVPAWSEPGRRSVTNLHTAFENIIVELKTATEPGVAVARPPSPAPPDYLDDPLHRWVLENQYVRVYDVRMPPGATTTFHRHAYDAVNLRVSAGVISAQLQDASTWGPQRRLDAGSLVFDKDAKSPYSHRVRNEGPAEYHSILVQLLQSR